jgi:hypothetical protein
MTRNINMEWMEENNHCMCVVYGTRVIQLKAKHMKIDINGILNVIIDRRQGSKFESASHN